MLDLGADGGGVAVGDTAVLLGEGLTAEAMARRVGTINYEITCGITARVPRAYHRDGVPVA
jgi:alanine racemase